MFGTGLLLVVTALVVGIIALFTGQWLVVAAMFVSALCVGAQLNDV